LTVSFTETANLQFKPLVESVEDHNNHQGLTWVAKKGKPQVRYPY